MAGAASICGAPTRLGRCPHQESLLVACGVPYSVDMRPLPALVAVAIAGTLSCSTEPHTDPHYFPLGCRANCPGQGTINVDLQVERCGSGGQCTTRPLNRRNVYLEVIELSGPREERCGLGDCGGVVSALRIQGWQAGRLKIVAPPLQTLQPPPPIIIELEEYEMEELTLTYREKTGNDSLTS